MTLPIRSTAHEELDYPPPLNYVRDRPAPAPAPVVLALRALADWLVAHPEVPAPTIVDVQAHLQGPLEECLDRLAAFTDRHGGARKQHGSTIWSEWVLRDTPSATVTYRLSATLPGGQG